MDKAPESVAIVAMGRSMSTYCGFGVTHGVRSRVADEIWSINSAGAVIQYDRAFVMDDLKGELEPKARENPESMPAGMLEWLKTAHGPIYTCKAYPKDYPGTVEYPLEEVYNKISPPYLNTTVAYALAYALHLDVKRIGFYGCDFTYADVHVAESGRGCCEFMMGMAASRGVQIVVASNSTLMDACVPPEHKFYGYLDPIIWKQDESGRWRITEPEPGDATPEAPLKAAAGASGLRLAGGNDS